MFRKVQLTVCLLICLVGRAPARATFDLSFNVNSSGFTPTQLTNLQTSLDLAKARWESAITGYQPGISVMGVAINVSAGSAFAAATVNSSVLQGGFRVATAGSLFVNPAVIDGFFSWDGAGPQNPNPDFLGLNYLDDILAHEVGHALGIGTLWSSNGVSTGGTGQYTGVHGVRAYQLEFDPLASFVPVEQAGGPGTPDNHWNQLMRSSVQEGNPADPWSLSPLTGITDAQGRDFALELMTGALDPDFGEPFLSNTTIQSLRDLGFTVVPEPSGMILLLAAVAMLYHSRWRKMTVVPSQRMRRISGESSRRLSTTRSAWESSSRVAVPVSATLAMPARLAASMPAGASSTTTHSPGSAPNRSAAI